jgi:hypothetical protein
MKAPRNSVGSTAAEQGLAEEEALKKGMAEKVPRVHGQRALRQGVIFRCFLPATQVMEN